MNSQLSHPLNTWKSLSHYHENKRITVSLFFNETRAKDPMCFYSLFYFCEFCKLRLCLWGFVYLYSNQKSMLSKVYGIKQNYSVLNNTVLKYLNTAKVTAIKWCARGLLARGEDWDLSQKMFCHIVGHGYKWKEFWNQSQGYSWFLDAAQLFCIQRSRTWSTSSTRSL